MLLSYIELTQLVEKGYIQNADGSVVAQERINSSSIDITMGEKILVEENPEQFVQRRSSIIELNLREPLNMREEDLRKNYHLLRPGKFILAQSAEVFHLPAHISCEYKLKSSLARIGLEHMNAGWCDAGWNGSVLTLEFKNMTNYHTILIRPGDRIGQVVFFAHTAVPEHASYASRGRYNGDLTVRGIKP